MYKNKISVITPSIRPEGLEIVKKALENQTFNDFDWYIGSSFKPNNWATWIKDDFKGGCWSLNRIYNKMIANSEGELIVSWQDNTSADPEILDKLWQRYEKTQNGLVSVTGNKYYDETFSLESWFDPRSSNVPLRETDFYDVEWNLCSCPREALLKCGGFMEDLDFCGFGMDGYCVNERLKELGYRFFLDNSVKTYSTMHGRVKNWEENNLIHKWGEIKERLKKEGKWPIVDYLKA